MFHHPRIGLLGGSFNPAHEGHIHLSLEAKKRLGLDQIVWLLSLQNPLKSPEDMASYDKRLAHAHALTAPYPFISVSDFEQKHKLYYSSQTIPALQQRYPDIKFIWLMGADNLGSFHRWRNWQTLFESIPIAVVDRAPFAHHALRSKTAIRYRQARLPDHAAARLVQCNTPAWSYLFIPRHPQSATVLRKTLGEAAFLCENENSE